jgi:hypothetical protein
LAVDTSQSFISYALLFQSPTIMHRLFVAMTTLAALAVVLHPSPCVSAATINVNIGSVTWFLGNGIIPGNTNGRGHAAQFALPQACAFMNNGSLLITDTSNNKIRRVVQPRDDLVEDWMGNGVFGDVNGVGTAARYTVPLAIVVMANNTFAFVVEGQAISQINIAASLKSAFVGLNFLPGTADGSGTSARFRVPVCITIFHATTTLFVGELARIRRVSRAGGVSVLSGSIFTGFVDGDSATARYFAPQGITTAQSALILFVTDSNAIRRVIAPAHVSRSQVPRVQDTRTVPRRQQRSALLQALSWTSSSSRCTSPICSTTSSVAWI